MTREEIVEHLENEYPDGEFILAEGFEDAFVGIITRYGMDPIAMYDYDRCIKILMDQDMDEETASEYFGFNVLGSWNGVQTPAFAMFTPGVIRKLAAD